MDNPTIMSNDTNGVNDIPLEDNPPLVSNLKDTTDNVTSDNVESTNINSSEITHSQPPRDIELFNEALQSYLALQKEIAEIEAEVRIRKSKLQALSSTLMSYIKFHNIKDIKLEGEYRGTTLAPVYNKTVSFDKTTIISTLQEYFADNLDEFEKIMARISENANVRETSKLTLKKPKKLTSKSRYDTDLQQADKILETDLPVAN